MRSKSIICLLLCLSHYCSFGQYGSLFDLNTFAMFCNNTPIDFDISSSISGDESKITLGQTHYNPWEISNHHKFGDQVTAVFLGILLRINPEHSERIFMSKMNRSNDIIRNESYTIRHIVSHGTDTLFTIYLHFENPAFSFDQTVYYNIIYPDGTTDVPMPGIRLADNTGNKPQEATRIIRNNQTGYKLVFGTYDLQNDITDNVLFSLSEVQPGSKYTITPDPSDTLNPNIINMWTYNPGFLKPVGFNDNEEDERVPVFHLGIPDNMDVIVFQEFFERDLNIRLMDSLRHRYRFQSTNRHNEPNTPVVGKDGGVRVVSKFPILEERDISFLENGCTNPDFISGSANKGVKYVKINKLGQIIHVFGTHTGVQPCDFYVMSSFIKTFSLPKEDVIIFAGDFNVTLDQFTDDTYNVYQDVMDTLQAIEATYQTLTWDSPYRGTYWGYNHWDSEGSENNRNFIDYILTSKNGKIPLKNNNYTQVARINSTDRKFWGVFDLGDHNPVYGRIELPYLTVHTSDTVVCTGNSVLLTASTNIPNPVFNWYKSDALIYSTPDSTFVTSNAADPITHYICKVQYSYMPDTNINKIPVFDSIQKKYIFRGSFESIIQDSVMVRNCSVSAAPSTMTPIFRIFPNPASDYLTIEGALSENISILLYDNMGRLLFRQNKLTSNVLNVSGLASGTYQLIITRKDTIVFQDKINIIRMR
jgi:endonuclease/exonuclease/phosphatase family metal-dependent hydrolase